MPECYKPGAARTRLELLEWLLSTFHTRRGGGDYRVRGDFRVSGEESWLWCFNVKTYAALGFDALWNKALEDGQDIEETDRWKELSRGVWEENFNGKNQGEYFNQVLEDARRQFQDNDKWCATLYDGSEVDAEVAFLGRSGGWMTLTRFEGRILNPEFDPTDMAMESLEKLCELICHCRWVQTHVDDLVVSAAAWLLFQNLCDGIPRHEQLVQEWSI